MGAPVGLCAKKSRLAAESVIAFSFLPVRLLSGLGIAIAILGFSYALFVTARAFFGTPVEGAGRRSWWWCSLWAASNSNPWRDRRICLAHAARGPVAASVHGGGDGRRFEGIACRLAQCTGGRRGRARRIPNGCVIMGRFSGSTVLVTGGAGFIGSELVRQLNAEGCRVIVVDNLCNGRRENLAGLDPGRCHLEVADIRDIDRVRSMLDGIDVVFHLACLGVRHSLHAPLENHDVNSTATLNLVAVAKSSGVARFVYVSSSEVYGTARWVPMAEDHPTFPMTVYGASKLGGECYARAFWESYRYPTIIIRPFNAFGPRCHHEGDTGEVIPKFMLRAMAEAPLIIFGDGKQTRDFSYVADTARGIMHAGFSDKAVGETFNLGSGSEIEIRTLADIILEEVGHTSSQIEHDVPRPAM